MLHLLDLLEKRGDQGQEALERRAAPEALQVPVHRVPPDQQQVAAAQEIDKAIANSLEDLKRNPHDEVSEQMLNESFNDKLNLLKDFSDL